MFRAGGVGVGAGASRASLGELAARVPFATLAPDDPLVLSANAYALAARGQCYVFYLYDGGTARIDLRAGSGPFAVEWFDPRDGSRHPAPPARGGRIKAFAAPSPGDWVLYLHKQIP